MAMNTLKTCALAAVIALAAGSAVTTSASAHGFGGFGGFHFGGMHFGGGHFNAARVFGFGSRYAYGPRWGYRYRVRAPLYYGSYCPAGTYRAYSGRCIVRYY